MVSCKEVQRLLGESLDLELELSGAAEAHIERCGACGEAREELSFLRGILAEAEPEPLPNDFELSLRRRLASEDRQMSAADSSGTGSSKTTWILASAVAAAAVILLVVGSALRIGAPVAPPTTYHQLRLSVRCAEDLPNALFDVGLPPDVRLSPEVGALGKGARIRWRSRLKAGVNEIDIPLVSRRTHASVVVRLTVYGKTIESRARLSTRSARLGGRGRVTLALVVGERAGRGRL